MSDFYSLLASLTSREREVACYIVQGRANKYIAAELGVSQRTIESHRSRIFSKMGVRNAVQLASLESIYPTTACCNFRQEQRLARQLDLCLLGGSNATVARGVDHLVVQAVRR